jgi:DNA transformation protein
MDKQPKMKNIGVVSRQWLAEIGVHSVADIDDIGVIEVYRRLQAVNPTISRVMLWALQGAVMDLPYNQLPPDIKAQLLAELGE